MARSPGRTMTGSGRVLLALWLASCGADHEGPSITVDVTGDDTTIADPGWDPAVDSVPADTMLEIPEVPDVPFDDICYAEDLPLQYDVRSDVLIVLDRSGSMAMMLTHLENAVNAIVGASDDKIWFGLMPFPSSVTPNVCTLLNPFSQCYVPALPHVMLGPLNAAPIASVFSGLNICGSTPTSATLQSALAYLSTTSTGHDQYVLLATDGVPNCNGSLDGDTCTCLDTETGCSGNPESCLDDQACYDALDALSSAGIPTYVLAMGGAFSGSDIAILNSMAVHGGTGAYYPAENPADILTAFESIMSAVVLSCEFELNPSDAADPTLVNIYVGGVIVPRDESHSSGWDYLDSDTIMFYGPLCESIMEGDVSTVSASYGCPTVFL